MPQIPRTAIVADLGPPVGDYSHVSRAGDFVYLSGMAGVGQDNVPISADFAAQVHQTFRNIATALASESMTLENVVKFTTYVDNAANLDTLWEARAAAFTEHGLTKEKFPPHSVYVIESLADEGLLIEVDTIAWGKL